MGENLPFFGLKNHLLIFLKFSSIELKVAFNFNIHIDYLDLARFKFTY